MIDIHTHILPGIDDGCENFEQAIFLLNDSVNQNVTDLFLTPHRRKAFNANISEILKQYELLCSLAKKEGFNINLYYGQEIFVDRDFKKLLNDKEVIGLGGSNVLLLEFDYFKRTDIAEICYETKCKGYIPVCAHVERYDYFSVEEAVEVKDVGGFIQVNAGSLIKKIDNRAQRKKALKFFDEKLVDFVASDTHFTRGNMLASAREVIVKRYGKQMANDVFYNNAKELILDRIKG